MLNVLFLDVDGVLNNPKDLRLNSYDFICPYKVNRVKRIIKHFDCHVVLSSTWRLDDHDARLVSNFIDFQDKTPVSQHVEAWSVERSHARDRKIEILQWIRETNLDIDKCIVLDDLDIESPKLQPVVINGKFGITDKDVEDIIKEFT